MVDRNLMLNSHLTLVAEMPILGTDPFTDPLTVAESGCNTGLRIGRRSRAYRLLAGLEICGTAGQATCATGGAARSTQMRESKDLPRVTVVSGRAVPPDWRPPRRRQPAPPAESGPRRLSHLISAPAHREGQTLKPGPRRCCRQCPCNEPLLRRCVCPGLPCVMPAVEGLAGHPE